jgi:hypothetical protein
MPRGKRSKVAKDHHTKADQIRKAAHELPKPVRPRDVIAKLKEEGVEVTPNHVAQVLRSSGFRRKRRRRSAGGAASPTAGTSGHGLNVEALLAAKALIAKVGSVEAAVEALKTLKRLQ